MFNFTICAIQQQNTTSESLDAFKLGRDKSSIQNLADSSYTSRNCDICIGVNSPYRNEKKDWNNYDITKFKDYFRYAEILINRQGSSGGTIPLFYLGKVCKVEQNVFTRRHEIDVLLPELHVGIEYDGWYYHSKPKQKERDKRKEVFYAKHIKPL